MRGIEIGGASPVFARGVHSASLSTPKLTTMPEKSLRGGGY
jgi:hypothetical protein